MTIQHGIITDPNIHEPKGIAGAPSNLVYVSDGLGSGVWQKPDSLVLKGLSGDSGQSNRVVMSDGNNGFRLAARDVYGQMTITNNTNAFTMVAAADPTLQNTADYVVLTATGAPWASEQLFGGMTFTTDRLTIPTNGVYELQFWSSISQFPTNTATIGARARANGSIFSTRTVVTKSNSVGDSGQLHGFGLFPFTAGDYVQMMVASTAAGPLIFRNINVLLKLIRAT